MAAAQSELEPVGTGSEPHRRGPVLLVAGLIAALLAVAVINQHRADRSTPQLPVVPVTTVRNDPEITGLALPGHPVDVAASGSLLYVLVSAPDRLLLLDHSDPNQVLQSAPVDIGSRARVIIDIDSARVWVLTTDIDDNSLLIEFDPLSLKRLAITPLGRGVFTVVPLGDSLWLATDEGLGRVPLLGPMVRRTTAIRGTVTALVASRIDYTLLVGIADGNQTTVRWVSPDTVATVAAASLPIRSIDVALVGAMVWAAGVRVDGQGTVLRLDSTTLRPVPSPISLLVREPGVTVWTGIRNLWVLDGGVLSCLEPRSGTLLTSAPRVSGPVVSSSGYVYAIGSRSVKVLDLSRTPCLLG
jgi:hypothetical protein